MLYFLIGFFLIFLSFIEIFYRKGQNSKLSFIISLFLLFLFSGLRHEVGKDWPSYLNLYNNVEFANRKIEFGYALINEFFSTFGISFNFFILFLSAITLFFIYKFGIRLKYKLIFLFVYFSDLFLYLNFSGVRQGLGIAITLFSFRYILDKKLIHFFATVAFASLFHYTALFFVVAYFAYWYKQAMVKNIILLSLFATAWIFLDNLINFIVSIFPDNQKIQYYLNNENVTSNSFQSYLIGVLKRSIVLLLCFSALRFSSEDVVFKKVIQIYLIGFFVFLIMFPFSGDIGVRIGGYFLIFDCMLISTLFQQRIHIYHKAIIFFVVALVCFYKIYTYASLPEYIYKVFL